VSREILKNRKAHRSHRFSINSKGNILIIYFKTKVSTSIFKTSLGGTGTSGLTYMILCGQLHVNCACPVQDSFSSLARLMCVIVPVLLNPALLLCVLEAV